MASSIPVPADLLADPKTIESREMRYPLYVHSEVVDEMVRRDSLKRRVSLVLQHLAARGRTGVVKSCVKQENRGWRRTPMGGNHGSQFYLWWTHGGSGVMPEPMGLRRSVWIRALRHHDNMTRLAPGDPEKDYQLLELRDITGDDDKFAQRPWTAQQTGFIESEAPIRIIYGHPGSGKTTSLWQSVNARSGERVLYTSWSRELVAQAEEHFASFASASSEVLAYDYQTIIGMSCGYDVARLTHARRLSLLEGAIRDARLQRSLLGPWFDRTPELYAEIRSYLLGMAAGQYPTLHGPEELSRLTRDSYLALRGPFNDERVTDSLMRVFSALERAERLGDIFPDMLAASRARARLEEGILPDGFESLDRIVMDEIQDLTLLEMSVFTVLARAIGRHRGRLPWLLLSGDEGQTVLPTGFDWGPVSSLVARELRAPREFGLDEKLRAPGRFSEVVERASSIYRSLNRSLRPSNQQVREVQDVLEARLYYVVARDEREASWLLERLSQIEGVAIITTAHAPPTWTPDAVRSLILTPQSAKGLEYPTVCVLDPGATLAELSAPKSEYSTAQGIETQMLRTSIDRFRVAVSRSTETLVFLDVGPDESISALSRQILGDSISCAPELLLEYLTPSDALPEDLALARIRESRELLDGAPAAAWNRAAQAVQLLGRPGIPNGIADEEVRRDVHHNLMVVGCRVVTDAPEADLGDVKRLCIASACELDGGDNAAAFQRFCDWMADPSESPLQMLTSLMPLDDPGSWIAGSMSSCYQTLQSGLERAAWSTEGAELFQEDVEKWLSLSGYTGDIRRRADALRLSAFNTLIEAGRYAAARAALRYVSVEMSRQRAEREFSTGDFKRASHLFFRAGMVDETDESVARHAEYLLDTADALVRDHSYKEALSLCDDIDCFTEFWEVVAFWRAPVALRRGMAYLLTGRNAEGEVQYETVIRHAETDELRAVGYTGYASALYYQERLEAALQACEEAIRLDPQSEIEYLPHYPPMKRAVGIHHRRYEFAKAAEYGRRALRFYPDDIELLSLMTSACQQLGEYEEGIEYCENGLNLDINSSDLWMVRSRIYASMRDYAEAEASLDMYLSMEQDNDTAHLSRLYRGFARGKQGKYEEALSDLNEAVDKLPSWHIATNLCRADIYLQQGRYASALDDYDIAALSMAGSTDIHILYLEVFYEAGEYDSALEACGRIIDIDGPRDDVFMAYRHIHAAMGHMGDTDNNENSAMQETMLSDVSGMLPSTELEGAPFPLSLRIRDKVIRDSLGFTPITQSPGDVKRHFIIIGADGEIQGISSPI